MKEVQYLGDTAIKLVEDWLSDHGLSLAADIALSIIAGLPPVDLIPAKRAEMYREGMVAEEDEFYQGQR